jgi:hypothetical protein
MADRLLWLLGQVAAYAFKTFSEKEKAPTRGAPCCSVLFYYYERCK